MSLHHHRRFDRNRRHVYRESRLAATGRFWKAGELIPTDRHATMRGREKREPDADNIGLPECRNGPAEKVRRAAIPLEDTRSWPEMQDTICPRPSGRPLFRAPSWRPERTGGPSR